MRFLHYLLVIVLSTVTSVAMAKQSPTSEVPSSKSQGTTFVNATCEETFRPNGKVEELYWTQGEDNKPVTGNEVDQYVDLNLVVKTTGYQNGDCIEVQLSSDEGDIAVGIKKIVLRDNVNEDGRLYFKQPLKNFTVIIR